MKKYLVPKIEIFVVKPIFILSVSKKELPDVIYLNPDTAIPGDSSITADGKANSFSFSTEEEGLWNKGDSWNEE
jgi:hypothetical protein